MVDRETRGATFFNVFCALWAAQSFPISRSQSCATVLWPRIERNANAFGVGYDRVRGLARSPFPG